ncbi:MAG: hypothetical protein IH623_06410 [Verrucomicrobia bacterium]|nr:hypothetical protein [Verrucomicrobiota bacterium]
MKASKETHRLALRFSETGPIQLDKTYFWFGENQPPIEKPFDGTVKGLAWDKNAMSLCYWLIRYRISKHRPDSGFYEVPHDGKTGLFDTLLNLLDTPRNFNEVFGKESGSGGNARNVLKIIFPQTHPRRHRKATIDPVRLPADAIIIRRGTKDVAAPAALTKILEEIETAYAAQPSRKKDRVKPTTALTPTTPGPQTPIGDAPAASQPQPPPEEKNPHNLQEAPVRFFGHEQLRKEVTAKLAHKGLIVLHETGGVGKTTFAKQTAYDGIQNGRLAGGAVWIDCEPNPALEQCVRTMAEVLLGSRMESSPVANCEKLLNDYFARHHTLIVFDNFETVLSNDDCNKFLISHAAKCCILVTTREIHDGMKPYVQALGELGRDDAIQMFLFEAGLENLSGKDKSTVGHLCESVGHIPLAILLLARQAPKTTLSQLADELRKNTDVLATDDSFLAARHRSMAACFQISFKRLDREDQETLFRFAVAPAGLGKAFARDYLDKPNWLGSVKNCVNSALLKLEGGRYNFHPLVRSFLYDQMPDQKKDWADHFVDFFCTRLDTAANEGRIPKIAIEEKVNCHEALISAEKFQRVEHTLVVWELLEDARNRTAPFKRVTPLWMQPSGFATQEWIERDPLFLESALVDAKNNEDTRRTERILRQQMSEAGEARSPSEENRILKQLSRIISRPRAEGMRFDLKAKTHFANREWGGAEAALEQSIAAWQSAGPAFHRYRVAAMVNHLETLFRQNKGGEAASRAKILRPLWSMECRLVSDWLYSGFESHSDLQWFRAATPVDEIRLQFNGAWLLKHHLASIPQDIGRELFRLKQWAESANWLEVALSLSKNDPVAQVVGLDHVLLNLAEAYTNSGQYDRAKTVFFEVSPNDSRTFGRWYRGLANLKAKQAEFGAAIELAKESMIVYEKWLKEVEEAAGTDSEISEHLGEHLDIGESARIECARAVPELRRLIAKWRLKAEGGKKKPTR